MIQIVLLFIFTSIRWPKQNSQVFNFLVGSFVANFTGNFTIGLTGDFVGSFVGFHRKF
jgi:hypothetical protein